MIDARMQWRVDPEISFVNLNNGIKNKALRIALSAGASPIKQAIVSQAPSDTGNLKKAQKIKIKSYRGGSLWVAAVGASSKFTRTKGKGKNKRKVRPGRYQAPLDRGTKDISPRNFMSSAYKSSEQQAAQATLRKLSEVIRQIIASQGTT
jgi:HK97 gp10 family phage protein